MYLVIWKSILLLGWLIFLMLCCKKKNLLFALIAVLWLGTVAIVCEVIPMKIGYALPSASSDRQVSTFLLDTWRQNKEIERPSFWDKGAYVALANSYSSGNRFGEDLAYEGIPTLISPIYPKIVSLFHKITRIDLIKVYDLGGILVLIAVGIIFYFFGSPRDPHVKLEPREHHYEGIIIAFCLLYLSAQGMPFDAERILTRANFWNTFVLLKPGHLLIYAFIPLLFYCLAKNPNWKKTFLAGIVLGLMLSIYFASFIYIGTGLFIFLLFLFVTQKKIFKQEILRYLWIFLIALISSSWLWGPIVGYVITSNEVIPFNQIFSSWHLPRRVYDPLESTFFMGPLFWLGLVGIFVMLKRKRKGDYILLGFISSTYLFKLIIYPLLWYFFKFSYHAGECYEYFLRPAMAMSAGVAVNAIIDSIRKNHVAIKNFIKSILRKSIQILNLLRKSSRLTGFSLESKASLVVAFFLILSPYATPIWHIPSFNWWSHFDTKPRSYENEHLLNWIKNETKQDAVFLADHLTSLFINTYTGRKLLKATGNGPTLGNFNTRKEAARIIYEYNTHTADLKDFIKKYHVSYVIWNNRVQREYRHANLNCLENTDVFTKVYLHDSLTIYKAK